MRTRVRVDAFPNRPLAGQVATVSSVPLQRDWVQRNVKVYPVIVSLSDQSPGLKPGMTAEVTLMVREGKPGSEAPAHRP
jgi:hypothetical protein